MGHFERERELQQRVERHVAAALPTVRVLDLELDDPRGVIRIYVDSPEGVTHGVCAQVTTLVRDELGDYAIETSSPGPEPPLRAPETFREAVGGTVRMRTRGAKRAFTARLVDVASEAVRVEREDGTTADVPFSDIARSRLLSTAVVASAAKQKAQPFIAPGDVEQKETT